MLAGFLFFFSTSQGGLELDLGEFYPLRLRSTSVQDRDRYVLPLFGEPFWEVKDTRATYDSQLG